MAEVWLAEDTRLGRWVAVKVLLALTGDDLGTSMADEARVIARLQHPNIVAAYDAGEFEGRHFVVLEYVNGYSVRELLESHGPFGEAEAVRIGSQLASALQYAHQQGILHSDIKPENILITESGSAKLADFGTAEAVTRTLTPEQAREVLGTIAYLAPEVLQGSPATPASDVYSLGLTLYEMLLGRLPFAGASPAAIAAQRLASPAPALRSQVPGASPQLETLLASAIAIRPEERLQSAGQFAGGLRGVPQRNGNPTGRTQTQPRPVVVAPPAIVTRPAQRRQPTGRIVTRAEQLPPPGTNSGMLIAAVTAVVLGLGAAAVGAYLLLSNNDDGGSPSPTPTTTGSATANASPTAEPTQTARPQDTATATTQATETPTQTPTATQTQNPPTATNTTAPPTNTASPTRTATQGPPTNTVPAQPTTQPSDQPSPKP